MRGIGRLVAEDAPGADNPERRREPFHAAYLDRRCVGAEQIAVFRPEGVLHIARGVVLRNVERFEVIIIGFHFGAVQHLESHRCKNILDFVLYLRQRMQMAAYKLLSAVGVRQRRSIHSS